MNGRILFHSIDRTIDWLINCKLVSLSDYTKLGETTIQFSTDPVAMGRGVGGCGSGVVAEEGEGTNVDKMVSHTSVLWQQVKIKIFSSIRCPSF